jgi:uncharacterized protein YcbK (DUF882 family)
MGGGVAGATANVGQDITDYLQAVGEYFDVTLQVTSGYRSGDEQASAMFNNWINLQRGRVYKKTTLPETDRQSLDDYYKTAKETSQAKEAEIAEAKKKFLDLAKDRVGSKSNHTKGRAVDIAQSSVTAKAYSAISMGLSEVDEGRDDIYHFESVDPVKKVDDAMKKRWEAIK